MRDQVERSWQAFLERAHAHPDRWDAPTRLAGWTVADLAAHVCWGISLEADALERALSGITEPADGQSPPPGSSREQVLGVLRENCDRLLAALDAVHELEARAAGSAVGVPETLPMPYGEVPLELGKAIFVMEAGAHSSDLAAAVGDDDSLEPDVCQATFAVHAVFAPLLATAAGTTPPPGSVIELNADGQVLRLGADDDGQWTSTPAGPTTTTITGDLSDVTLFLLGRRPIEAVTVRGDRSLAERFKELVPGP